MPVYSAVQRQIQTFWKVGSEDNVSASSSFITNAHNELYAFCTVKGGLLQKNLSNEGVAAPTAAASLWIRH